MLAKKIYVASSWRNKQQQYLVNLLRELGHEVYDFKHPAPGESGFGWSRMDENWLSWTTEIYLKHLYYPLANRGFMLDWEAMEWADTCVLLLPSGRSAHIEAGYFIGSKKELHIVLSNEDFEPELMYKMTDFIYPSIEDFEKKWREYVKVS